LTKKSSSLFSKTSDTLEPLYAIGRLKKEGKFNKMPLAKFSIKKEEKL